VCNNMTSKIEEPIPIRDMDNKIMDASEKISSK
jgi:hypothetical protein